MKYNSVKLVYKKIPQAIHSLARFTFPRYFLPIRKKLRQDVYRRERMYKTHSLVVKNCIGQEITPLEAHS